MSPVDILKINPHRGKRTDGDLSVCTVVCVHRELFVSDSRHVFGAAVLLSDRGGRSALRLHTDSTD